MASDLDPGAQERLQKFLSRAGVASRRTAEALIAAGRVKLNGEVVTALGTKLDPARDVVHVDDSRVEVDAWPRETWAIHKPPGMLTTLNDPQSRPTVRQLVADLPVRLYPVGRLDWDADGLLLMSNDGALTHRLTHPSFGVPRTYRAIVKGKLSPNTVEQLRGEMQLEDGPVRTLAVTGESGERRSLLIITVGEGRNHLVKRLCEAVGHEVEQLTRLEYGGVKLGDLSPRGRRKLSAAELDTLRQAVREPT